MSQQQHKRYFTERISKFQFLPRIQQRTLTKAMKQKQDILTISSSIWFHTESFLESILEKKKKTHVFWPPAVVVVSTKK